MDGVSFDEAWKQAVRSITWPWNKGGRDDWKVVIRSTRPAWESCYNDVGEPLNVEHLMAALIHEVDLDEDCMSAVA